MCTGTSVGLQRGICDQLVVRADIIRIHRSITHAQLARQRQQCCQLHSLLRGRTEISPRILADVMSVYALRRR